MRWSPGGLVLSSPDAQGNVTPEQHPSGMPLKESLTKDQMFEELKISYKLLRLVLVQLAMARRLT